MPHGAGRVDQMAPVGMPEGTPVHVAVISDLDLTLDSHDRPGVVESEIRDEDLQEIVGVPIASVGDASSVGREERAAVVTRRGDEMVDVYWNGQTATELPQPRIKIKEECKGCTRTCPLLIPKRRGVRRRLSWYHLDQKRKTEGKKKSPKREK